MITQGPYALVAGTPVELPDPGSQLGYSSAHIQVQNQTGFTLTVTNGVTQSSIQSYSVKTLDLLGDGSSVFVLPASVGRTPVTNALTVVWLLANEKPPMTDGPLSVSTSVNLTVQLQPTGGPQSIVVPATTTSMTVDMAGAQGGSYGAGVGGNGGRVQAMIPVTPGETLTIDVAKAGTAPYSSGANQPGGYGVAPGGTGVYKFGTQNSGSGGGASGILRGASLILAAGGGGGYGVAGTGGGVGAGVA